MSKRHMWTGAAAVLIVSLVVPAAFARQGAAPKARPPKTAKPVERATTVRPVEKPADPQRPRPEPTKEPQRPVEELRMHCRALDARPAVGCEWSQAQHPAFAAYELWRGDGEARRIVFATRNREQTRYVDADVRPGATYVYGIRVVNGGGQVIGKGGPVKVQVPGERPDDQMRLACEPVRPDAIACKWSASQRRALDHYELWRGDGEGRHMVFASRDATSFVDENLRPGGYVYVVHALDAAGQIVGRGGPVKVQLPAGDRPAEQLRLACERVRDNAVACKWSASEHPDFAGYRLWRGDESGKHVVFETRDRAATQHLDADAPQGAAYLVQALDGNGKVIASGGPVRVDGSRDTTAK